MQRLNALSAKRVLTVKQFRQRVGQLLQSYSEVAPGEKFSPLQKLVKGMPRKLKQVRANRYGRCGK